MTAIMMLLGQRSVRIGLAVLGAVLLVLLAVKCVRDDAASDERARIEARAEQERARQRAVEWKAEQVRRHAENEAYLQSRERMKEIDDATRDIPDRPTSARQRAIACAELMREAKAAGRSFSACGPAEAAGRAADDARGAGQ